MSKRVRRRGDIFPNENEYEACLSVFLKGLLADNVDNVRCVLLYGGLVRDGGPIPGWSDIDLIIVFRNILKRDGTAFSSFLSDTQWRYGIRIDVTQVDEQWLVDSRLAANVYSSEVLNALAMRPDVSRILYGTLPPVSFSPEHEKMAARFYISHTLGTFRRYLLEDVICRCAQPDLERSAARVTRWVFSIIRASLRLFNIYVHPYGPSLEQVKLLFPQVDLSIPYLLLGIRKDQGGVRPDHTLFISVEAFLETYVPFVLREAAKYEQLTAKE
jgi:predicted nucleotidyltransferase